VKQKRYGAPLARTKKKLCDVKDGINLAKQRKKAIRNKIRGSPVQSPLQNVVAH